MALQDQLQQIAAQASNRVSKEFLQTTSKEIQNLKGSRTAIGLQAGDKAPDFELWGADGKTYQLSDALHNGPAILSFYRGSW
ncbi:redoxin domain-containing protein [Effusibacillus dendaii]|uniref:Alkyl hydroperoxide reductase subunit C/ Thiol specific antioxidant domain-containing protein n=1 Tax=Effusibacillus dendaii TaxID=2743772 RepID=A0A7I8DCW1_9BACL|nr:hypothetical protein skT53_13550 [Effusibacillus dendaii]